MICGTCKASFSLFVFLRIHWLQMKCGSARAVWARVLEARRHGSSGRRILAEAWPDIYKGDPMPEEVKAMFRAKKEEGHED